MKNYIVIFLLSLVVVAPSCDNCKNDGCPISSIFRFEVRDSSGVSFFEPTLYMQTIQNDSIKVVGINDSKQTTELTILQEGQVFSFQPKVSYQNYLIEYPFADNDRLTFDLKTYNDPCCNSIVIEYLVEINSSGQQISSDSDSTFIFVK